VAACTSRSNRGNPRDPQLTSTDELKEERGVNLACEPFLGDARERATVGSDTKRDANAVSVELGEACCRVIERIKKFWGWLVRPRIRLYTPIRAPLSLVAHAASSSLLSILVIDCDLRSLGKRPLLARKSR